MPNNQSTHFNKTVNSVSASEFPLILVEINHPDLSSPIRVVNDKTDLISNGNTYTALAFRIVLPDQSETTQPKARLALDNVGKELVSWLEMSSGGAGATATLSQVMRSTPNVIEWQIQLDLTNVVITSLEVMGDLGFTDILNQPGVNVIYRPETAIGLF